MRGGPVNQSLPETVQAGLSDHDASVSPCAPHQDTQPTQAPASPVDAISKARNLDELERIRRAVMAVGEATYHWDVATDKIVWSANITDVIQTPDNVRISTGRGFADLLDPDNFTSRFDTVMRSTSKDDGAGVPFAIEYLIRPQNGGRRQSLWVEDCGRWYAGQDGQPAEVIGIVRQIDDRHERDQKLQFMVNCDPLTGMMNRGRLSEALAEIMMRAKEENSGCAFLIAGWTGVSSDSVPPVCSRPDWAGIPTVRRTLGRYQWEGR